MSGLFGALSRTGRPLPSELGQRMANSLRAQPADSEGQRQNELVLLGARRLWSVPEDVDSSPAHPRARFDQAPPFVDEQSQLWVLFDGRLDGRAALAAALGQPAADAPSDAALVAAAYRRWGADFPARLRGDFALAVWDVHSRQLLLARDPLGVRPLYWAQTRDVFAFASRARPLFCLPELARDLNPLRIAEYLSVEFADCEATFFRALQRLPPGHTLQLSCAVQPAGPSLRRYFAFQSADARDELPARSNADYAAEFRALFLDAVRERSRAPGKLGCLLSGGLDSSGLFGALRTLAAQGSLRCFSARFQDFPAIDEGPWLDLLGEAWPDLVRIELRADRMGPLDGIDALHAALDEPFHAPNLFVYDGLARLARDHGANVLLDGLDGDTVVDHGYGYLRELLFARRPRRFWAALRALHERTGLAYRALLRDFVFEPELGRLSRELERLGLVRRGYLAAPFAASSGLWSARRGRLQQALAAPRSLRESHRLALSHPILPYYLESHDKAAAALGVEHRHPYFDVRLMEFCLALPPEQRLYAGWDRVIQRRAFEGWVPEAIRARQSKSVWTENFARRLLDDPTQRIRGLLESAQSPLRAYCDLGRLRRDVARLRAGQVAERLVEVWCAISLGCWLEREPAAL